MAYLSTDSMPRDLFLKDTMYESPLVDSIHQFDNFSIWNLQVVNLRLNDDNYRY